MVRGRDRGTIDRVDRRLPQRERGPDGRSIRDRAGMAGKRADIAIGASRIYGIGEAVSGD